MGWLSQSTHTSMAEEQRWFGDGKDAGHDITDCNLHMHQMELD